MPERFDEPMIDAQLAHWDRAADIHVPVIVGWAAHHPLCTSVLAVTYDSSFPLLVCLAVLLALIRRFDRLWLLAFVFAATVVLSTTISVMWPARGAFAFFDYSPSLLAQLPHGAGIYHLHELQYFRSDRSPVLSLAGLQGVVRFPSFHCCVALMTIFATCGLRWLFPLSLVWNTLVLASTVPIGGHYGVDLPGGALLWLFATLAGIALTKCLPVSGESRILAPAQSVTPERSTPARGRLHPLRLETCDRRQP